MTPDEFVEQVGRLIESGRDQDALDLAARVGPSVKSALSFDQIDRISGLLEGAAMAADMSRATAAQGESGAGSVAAAVHRGPRGSSAGGR
jgi:hypothetical protein